MKLFKLTYIDLAAERERILRKGTYNKRQQKALLKLVDLFEAGEWQACIDWVNSKDNFPYNKKGEYPEQEHIGIEINSVLRNLGMYSYFTQEQLLKEVAEKFLK